MESGWLVLNVFPGASTLVFIGVPVCLEVGMGRKESYNQNERGEITKVSNMTKIYSVSVNIMKCFRIFTNSQEISFPRWLN